MSETEGGAANGAMQGAAAGAAFGPWGALIGAVVGGIAGAMGGAKKKEARKYAAKAAEARRKQQQMQLAVQRRDIIRQQRMARAQAVAAGASEEGVVSSAIQGASASLASQGKAAVNYFDNQVTLDNAYQMYAKKAGKAQAKSDEIFTFLGSAGSLATAAGDIYGLSKSTQTPTANTGAYTSFNNSAAVSNFNSSASFQTFGSSLNLGST